MPAVRRLADFLVELQQAAARGDAILDAFTRHTPFEGGAVYLRDRDANLRLAAKSTQFVAPEILADDPPSELVAAADRVLVPLRSGRDHLKPYRSFGDVPVTEADLQRWVETREAITLEGGTAVAVPVNGNNQIIGVLAAADRETRDGIGAFEANELRLLSLFANQVGIALENARLHRDALEKQAMERELELAATIQRDILPKSIPTIEGVEIAALSRPARRVGGDCHAFFERENGVTMLVADVSGKSMPAALLVSALPAAGQLLLREGPELGQAATDR